MRRKCYALGSFIFLIVSLNGFSQSPGGVSTNLRWWLKANAGVFSDNGTTGATVNGTTIQQWNDQSTVANNARQLTAGNKPVFNNSVINGYPALRFAGDQFIDGLAAPGIASGNSWIFFLAFRQTSFTAGLTNDGVGTYLMDRTSNTNNLMSLKIVNTDKFYLQKRNDDGSGIGGPITTASAASSLFLITDFYRQFGVAYGIFTNGKTDGPSGDDNGALTGPILRVGRHTSTTGGGLTGDLAEVIAYNTFPTTAQRQQIESYLALKYGITLDQSAGGEDYLSSAGTVIYPATTTHLTYNNNIAGIGTDTGSGLVQNASTSQNTTSVLTVSSPSTPGDGNFLMWGDDSPTISNSNNVPSPYVNRLSRVWRAKATGAVGTVTMAFDLTGLNIPMTNTSRFALLTNSSPDLSTATASTATRSISGNVVTFTGITLTDGLYFSIATDLIPGPGGVSPAAIWLRADNGAYVNAGTTLATSGQTVQQWNNFQGATTYNVSQSTAANRPTYLTATANSNPVIRYPVPGGNYFALDFGALSVPSSSSLDAFVAILPTSVNTGGTTSDGSGSYFIDRTTATNALFDLKVNGSKFGLQKRNDVNGGLGGPATTTSINTTKMQLVNYYRNYNVQYGIGYNGVVENTLTDADGPLTLPSMRLGNHASTNIGLVGDLPEFILYTRNLSATERVRVNTYLAIKYGVTLSQTSATNYVMSNSTVVYPAASANSGFAADVAGLGRDDVSSLSQLTSQSVNAGSMVKMSIASLASDLSFLIWGSNNGSVTAPNSTDVQAPVLRRLSRVWKVANTNSVGPVTVSIDLTTVPGAKAQADLRLLVDADGVFNAGATPLTGSLVGNIFTVTNVTLANGNFFTVGTTNLATPLPVQITSFEVAAAGNNVLASWKTASELNSDYFEIQRSKDGEEFQSLGKVRAAGTSTLAHDYIFDDPHPFDGKSYYRLLEYDIDGSLAFSEVRTVTVDNRQPHLSVYPNPTHGNTLHLQLENWKDGQVEIAVRNVLGNLLNLSQVSPDEAGAGEFVITLPEQTPPGIYIVTIKGVKTTFNVRVIIGQ